MQAGQQKRTKQWTAPVKKRGKKQPAKSYDVKLVKGFSLSVMCG